MHDHTDVDVTMVIKASNGPGAFAMIRNKVEALAPACTWSIRPIAVEPAGRPDTDGQHVGPPWLFRVAVTISVPVPEGP